MNKTLIGIFGALAAAVYFLTRSDNESSSLKDLQAEELDLIDQLEEKREEIESYEEDDDEGITDLELAGINALLEDNDDLIEDIKEAV